MAPFHHDIISISGVQLAKFRKTFWIEVTDQVAKRRKTETEATDIKRMRQSNWPRVSSLKQVELLHFDS